ncbi:MAG: DUF4124 domain-containing protein [Casimicrobiaceae bacterium]
MSTHLLRKALPALLAFACGLPLAHADIYTWTDESGRVNLSNLTPPEGVKVTRVVRESAPKVAPPREEAARDALRDAEVQVLAERVRQLQHEVELAKRPAPQPVEYRVMPAPPIIQYFPPPEVQYVAAAPPQYGGCDFGFDCGFGWSPGFYPANFVVLDKTHNRRGHPGRGGGHIAPRQHSPTGGHTAPWAPINPPRGGRGH